MPDIRTPVDGEPWPQADFYDQSALWSPSGIPGSPATGLTIGDLPLMTNGLAWSVGLGRASARGGRYRRTESFTQGSSAPNSNGSLSRRDRLVLRRNLTSRTFSVVLLQGTPASTPAHAALTQVEDGIWDTPLYSWLVQPSNVTTLTDIRDERAFLAPDGSGLPTYLSTAARDVAFASPALGQRCMVATVVGSTTRFQEWVWTNVNGVAQWTWPRAAQGVLARVSVSKAAFTAPATFAVIPEFNLSDVFMPAGRQIGLTLSASVAFGSTDIKYSLVAYQDSARVQRWNVAPSATYPGEPDHRVFSTVVTPAAGLHLYQVAGEKVQPTSGGSFMNIDPSTNQGPAIFTVTDLGAA